MLQEPGLRYYAPQESLEEMDMTLIVTIKTNDCIVLAADGMAYAARDGSNTPYPVQKLHVANDAWVFGFAGYAGPAPIHKEVEAEIAAGKLKFDGNLDMSARAYFEAICERLEKTYVPPNLKGTMILAGRGNDGLVIRTAELCKVENRLTFTFLEGPCEAIGYGAKWMTAKALIDMFMDCCSTPDALAELATFSIWRVALQELVIGRMENDYEISVCVLTLDTAQPSIKRLPVQQTLKRMHKWKKKLERACSIFLASASSTAR